MNLIAKSEADFDAPSVMNRPSLSSKLINFAMHQQAASSTRDVSLPVLALRVGVSVAFEIVKLKKKRVSKVYQIYVIVLKSCRQASSHRQIILTSVPLQLRSGNFLASMFKVSAKNSSIPKPPRLFSLDQVSQAAYALIKLTALDPSGV